MLIRIARISKSGFRVQGAVAAGLALDPAIFGIFASNAAPCAPFVKLPITLSSLLIGLMGMVDRKGPTTIEDVSDAAKERWSKLEDYRPPPLKQVMSAAPSKG